MEGRDRPPKASHPFPNNPGPIKLFSRRALPLLRGYLAFMGAFFMVGGINFYVTRHEKGPFGTDITMTKEQGGKFQEVVFALTDVRNLGLRLDYNKGNISLDPQMRFDDGITFVPPAESGTLVRLE